MLGQIDVMTC